MKSIYVNDGLLFRGLECATPKCSTFNTEPTCVDPANRESCVWDANTSACTLKCSTFNSTTCATAMGGTCGWDTKTKTCNDKTCVKLEVEGPHEIGDLTAKNQGATTYLKSGMNPFFYNDIGGGQGIAFIFKTTIVDTNKSCAFIQDAGHNGCGGDKCTGINNQFKLYSDAATAKECAKKNPNPNPPGYICTFTGSDQLSNMATAYNKFINDFTKSISDNPTIKQHTKGGCILMKENQVSSFWDQSNLANDLLAIGYFVISGDIAVSVDMATSPKQIQTQLSSATKIQTLLASTYNVTKPIVQITRTFKSTPIINNGKIYYGIFNDISFDPPPKITPPVDCDHLPSKSVNCSTLGMGSYCQFSTPTSFEGICHGTSSYCNCSNNYNETLSATCSKCKQTKL